MGFPLSFSLLFFFFLFSFSFSSFSFSIPIFSYFSPHSPCLTPLYPFLSASLTRIRRKSKKSHYLPTIVDEHVHHHLHETIQPAIEKEGLDPSVTHKRVDVKENIQEQSKHHGVTTNSAISVDEFQKKLDQAEK